MSEVRSIEESEADLFRARLARGFGRDIDREDEAARSRFLDLFEIDRTVAVFDEGDIVGTGGALSFELTVPCGRAVPMGGTTIITVQPSRRRRGVLREIMSYHLEDVASHNEPLAGLWASESSIYERFGYGVATRQHLLRLQTGDVAMHTPEPPGRVSLMEAEEALTSLRSVYESVRLRVPGMLSRSESWWSHRIARDGERDAEGWSAKRYAIYRDGGSSLGYAIYHQKLEWGDLFPSGGISVSEVVSATPGAHRGIWGLLTNVDLFTELEWRHAPVDDPLEFEVTDPRRIVRSVVDGLWVRLLDVPAALEARGYEEDGELTLKVEDHFRPQGSGVYRLEVKGGEATCRSSSGTPDLECDVDVLGHLYLGGGSAMGMARAGRLEGDEASIRSLHRIFRTDRAPWCPEVF